MGTESIRIKTVEPEGTLAGKSSARIRKKLLIKTIRLSRTTKRFLIASTILSVFVIFSLVYIELKTSFWQSMLLTNLASKLTYSLEKGASSQIIFPDDLGPYDHRLGYSMIPQVIESMQKRGFEVSAQARMSEEMIKLARYGVPATYENKTQAGLLITDRFGKQMFSVVRPESGFADFQQIPSLVVDTLLYIENKEILDKRSPYKNPAVEWDRFFRATFENLYQAINPDHSAPGGSTIATQLEKYRHSPFGMTRSVQDKLLQMFSASLKAYRSGRDTQASREHVVLSYINSIPLAAFPGYGEVSGLGDGLSTWFASDIAECSKALNEETVSDLKASCYRKILSLFVAHRRPSYYLKAGRQDLSESVNTYIRLMHNDGLISEELADAALKAKLYYRGGTYEPAVSSFLDRKAVNLIRSRLSSIIGLEKLYELDHFDLKAQTSIDQNVHQKVTATLQRLNDPDFVKALDLDQDRILQKGDPRKVIYSFTLFETENGVNKVRVQTDNFDGPFNINSGSKLDLGSTAKLRTLVSYLKILEDLYTELKPLTAKQRLGSKTGKLDPIGDWAVETLNASSALSLDEFLQLGMKRQYSANPGEVFYTGGGIHRFNNFKKEDNGRVVDLNIALRESINLPFVRLMRDIVRFYSVRLTAERGKISLAQNENREHEMRQAYLARFADSEGSQFLRTFYTDYRGLKEGQFFEKLLGSIGTASHKLAALHRYVYPQADLAEFTEFMQKHQPASESPDYLKLYNDYSAYKFDLNDRGYILKVHPLELWLVSYLEKNPHASQSEILNGSKDERQLVYKWLFKPSKKRAQDVRIKKLIEQDAFIPILTLWQQTGYPFDRIVPSYATSIGSSGDRPEALAELMGIILNDGKRLPIGSIEKLDFASGTPYETQIERKNNVEPVQVFSTQVAVTLKAALTDVVQNGTAKRLKDKVVLKDGTILAVGGKTGTGDHQYKVFSASGGLISSRVVSRSATFAFFIGDKYFGVVTAHVKGESAKNYNFTSALAAEVLKANLENLSSLFEKSE